jgi:MoaA/NifB/PqqE/SkfB family radical SAM enzyme
MLGILFSRYKRITSALHIMRNIRQLRRVVFGDRPFKKAAYVDGRYYWDLYAPGFGSPALRGYVEGEAHRIIPQKDRANRFTNVFISCTKKCPLRCAHCFEWKTLNGHDTLQVSDLTGLVGVFQQRGTSQIQLTGGEPMLYPDDLVTILTQAKPESDFWVLSSGFNVTYENAKRLKDAGLTGVVVSLDHYDPARHDAFRGADHSFLWAEAAVVNANAAKLVTALSICVTREFISEENLTRYLNLAKSWGVSFVQLLEPQAVGHFEGMDVKLTTDQIRLLTSFYHTVNYEHKYREYPIVTYHGYHQRKIGCFGAADRNLYVDADGAMRACPFCHNTSGSALSESVDENIEMLRQAGCANFPATNADGI